MAATKPGVDTVPAKAVKDEKGKISVEVKLKVAQDCKRRPSRQMKENTPDVPKPKTEEKPAALAANATAEILSKVSKAATPKKLGEKEKTPDAPKPKTNKEPAAQKPKATAAKALTAVQKENSPDVPKPKTDKEPAAQKHKATAAKALAAVQKENSPDVPKPKTDKEPAAQKPKATAAKAAPKKAEEPLILEEARRSAKGLKNQFNFRFVTAEEDGGAPKGLTNQFNFDFHLR